MVGAAEAERLRIERDLHDGAQQRLVSVAMELGRAKAKFDTDPEGARDLIDRAHAEAKEALVELRQLVRGVHPPVLTDRGLDAAVSGLAALSPIPVAVNVEVPERPSLTTEFIAYFVVAEFAHQRRQARPRAPRRGRHPRRRRDAAHDGARRRRRWRRPRGAGL